MSRKPAVSSVGTGTVYFVCCSCPHSTLYRLLYGQLTAFQTEADAKIVQVHCVRIGTLGGVLALNITNFSVCSRWLASPGVRDLLADLRESYVRARTFCIKIGNSKSLKYFISYSSLLRKSNRLRTHDNSLGVLCVGQETFYFNVAPLALIRKPEYHDVIK